MPGTTRGVERAKLTGLEGAGAIGLGTWAIGGPFWSEGSAVGWGDVDDAESVRAIHAALDLGVTFFDTADVYGAGHSERILGRALGARRAGVVIATKFGNTFDETTREITGTAATPDSIRNACEESLRRLGTDVIDVYLFHLSDYAPGPAAAVRDTLEDLVSAGRIRAYGWSTDDPARAAVFAEGPHCVAVEHALNVLFDAPAMLALGEVRGLASIARSPLAMGVLTGKFGTGSRLPTDDIRGAGAGWLTYFQDGRPTAEVLTRLEAIRSILTSDGRSLAAGAIGWIWARSDRTIPIPGFRTVAQVEQNVAALRHGPLSADQMREIDRLLGRGEGAA